MVLDDSKVGQHFSKLVGKLLILLGHLEFFLIFTSRVATSRAVRLIHLHSLHKAGKALALYFMYFAHLLGDPKNIFLDVFRNPFLRTGQTRNKLMDGKLATGGTPVELDASTPVDGIGGPEVIVPAVYWLQQGFGA